MITINEAGGSSRKDTLLFPRLTHDASMPDIGIVLTTQILLPSAETELNFRQWRAESFDFIKLRMRFTVGFNKEITTFLFYDDGLRTIAENVQKAKKGA